MAANINFATLSATAYKNISNFEIIYGFVESVFGCCMIGVHKDQLCYIGFPENEKKNSAIDNLKHEWPNAVLKQNDMVAQSFAEKIFANNTNSDLKVLLKGTDLQVHIWKELTNIPVGTTTTYESIAKAVGKPSAVRAVATAIARNKIAYVVPCHRVVHKTGNVSKYGWGAECKKNILDFEKTTYNLCTN